MSSKLPENAGSIAAGAVVVVAAAIYLMYGQGIVGEAVTGLALGLGVALASALMVFNAAQDGMRTSADRNIAIGFAALTFACVSGLVLMTVAPGTPAANGVLSATGQTLPLPADLSGTVRVLVHGDLPGQDEADVRFELKGTEKPLEGHLLRKVTTMRGRKGSSSRVSSATESAFLAGTIAGSGAHQLELASAHGLRGPLKISVYRSYLPENAAYALVALFVIACAAVGVKRGWKDTGAAAAGLGAVFGLAVFANGTPDALVRPEVGALLLCPFVGGIGGVALVWIMKRFIRPPAPRGGIAAGA